MGHRSVGIYGTQLTMENVGRLFGKLFDKLARESNGNIINLILFLGLVARVNGDITPYPASLTPGPPDPTPPDAHKKEAELIAYVIVAGLIALGVIACLRYCTRERKHNSHHHHLEHSNEVARVELVNGTADQCHELGQVVVDTAYSESRVVYSPVSSVD